MCLTLNSSGSYPRAGSGCEQKARCILGVTTGWLVRVQQGGWRAAQPPYPLVIDWNRVHWTLFREDFQVVLGCTNPSCCEFGCTVKTINFGLHTHYKLCWFIWCKNMVFLDVESIKQSWKLQNLHPFNKIFYFKPWCVLSKSGINKIPTT
jgi:hypothetical protein